MNKKLAAARRELERLEWEHARAARVDDTKAAYELEPAIRDARWAVDDLEAAERDTAVIQARRTARLLDVALAVDAALVMSFSLGNIHRFALAHGTQDPIAWTLAPMVDVALVAALGADAFLSRHGHTGSGWGTVLRWFGGLGTLVLNVWAAVVSLDVAAIVLHAVPPLLLVGLAEAAPHYRRGAVEVVRHAEREAQNDRAETPESPTAEPTESAGETATAPTVPATQDAPVPTDTPTPRTSDTPRTSTRRATRRKQVKGAGRTARAPKPDEAVLEELAALRTGAPAALAKRFVCTELGIGPARLDALLEREGLSLDPLPAFEVDAPRHGLRAVPAADAPSLREAVTT